MPHFRADTAVKNAMVLRKGPNSTVKSTSESEEVRMGRRKGKKVDKWFTKKRTYVYCFQHTELGKKVELKVSFAVKSEFLIVVFCFCPVLSKIEIM